LASASAVPPTTVTKLLSATPTAIPKINDAASMAKVK
jgi:hypothetical protein